MIFLVSRPPSPSMKRAASSIMSPAASTPAAPNESGGSGSAKGQSALGLVSVPNLIKPKRYLLKQYPQ